MTLVWQIFRRTELFPLARWFVAIVLVATLAVPTARAALLVTDYSTSVNDRFTNSPQFIGDYPQVPQTLNFSGVGYTNDDHWVTMISPDYFVSAAHFAPAAGETVTFYSGNNNSSQFAYTDTIASSGSFQTSVNGTPSDLYLGKLTTPIPSTANITYYPVLALNSVSDYLGLPIFVYGVPNRVGTDTIGSVYALSFGGDVTDVMQYSYSATTPNSAFLESGDSGGPSFVDWNGELALVGTHWLHATNNGHPDSSVDSFVPAYIHELDAHMTGAQVTLVPEPSGLALALAGLAALAAMRRRRPFPFSLRGWKGKLDS